MFDCSISKLIHKESTDKDFAGLEKHLVQSDRYTFHPFLNSGEFIFEYLSDYLI